jgi:hypothetical protein
MTLDAGELHQPLIDDKNNTQASKYDGTLAAWGGEPMGVTPAAHSHGQADAVDVIPVVGELDITRRYSAPSKVSSESGVFLSPLLRFGWPYFTAIIRVFPCGVAATLEAAGATISASDDNASLALPSVASSAGRRFLRHERLHAPISAVAFSDRNSRDALEFSTAKNGDIVVVRSSDAHPETNIDSVRRILIAPSVPLFFAAPHAVLDQVKSDRPPQGIPAATLLSDSDLRPTLLRIVAPQLDRKPDYYPDPAATYMALRLSGTSGRSSWASEPVIIETWRTWPETLPVRVTVRRIREPEGIASVVS